MENINTPEYWDEQFRKEWNVLQKFERATSIEKDSFYRWDNLKFGIIGSRILFRGKLLDIGCGLGHFCRYMKARNPYLEIYGCDFSPFAIKHAEKLTKQCGMKIEYKVGNALDLPYKDNTFDAVSAQEIIEHLSSPDEFIEEIKRVLKPGGKMYFSTPWRELIRKGLLSEEHFKEWTPQEFAILMRGHFEDGEIVFPPILTDFITKRTRPTFWFMAIATK